MSGIITIDGSRGEGGGQVLRSSLALSLVTGRPFVIEKIRAGRKKPGLLQQHLTAVLAAADVGSAEVEGAALGSRRLVFRPGPVRSGNYAFRVGTAGSATLVLQTVLPALLLAEGESNLVLEGGTHNPMAPPVDFLEKAYLPLVRRTTTVARPIRTKARRPRPQRISHGQRNSAVKRSRSCHELVSRDHLPWRKCLVA
jgi:RNA 3'-terminal phosphate cyclase (ATP)